MSDEPSRTPRPTRHVPLGVAGVLMLALFVFAFIAAPDACQWGLNAYAIAGLATIVTVAVLPFAGGTRLVRSRGASSILLGMAAVAVWIGGVFASNFQLLCRLF